MRRPIQFHNLSAEETARLLPDDPILLGFRGSIAHGTYRPKADPESIDDKDVLGVFVGPIEHYLGFGRQEQKSAFVGEWDVVCYEIRKFVRLLLSCNPNVLSLLWLPEKHYIYVHDLGRFLIENRELFVTKAAYASFTGYAHAQLKRMTHYTFEGYMGARRKALVEKYGFDCKNASHLIRLLRMGIEFLTEGRLIVERPDAEELVAIKRGEWALEKVQALADHLFRLAEEAYVRSRLPDRPDRNKAEDMAVQIIARYHRLWVGLKA